MSKSRLHSIATLQQRRAACLLGACACSAAVSEVDERSGGLGPLPRHRNDFMKGETYACEVSAADSAHMKFATLHARS